MTVLHQPNVDDKFCNHLIRRVARALVDEGTYSPSELDDAIQELRLALVEQAENFDAEKARWSTFAKTVVMSAAVSLRRRLRAERRQAPADLGSLNGLVPAADGELTELGSQVAEDEFRTGYGQGFIDHVEQVDVALDVKVVVGQLRPELQRLCDLLTRHSVSDVARILGLNRKTVMRRVAELRARFREAGLAPRT